MASLQATPHRQKFMERFRRGWSVPPSVLRRYAKAPAATWFRLNRVENSRFPARSGRRYAESSDALHCFFEPMLPLLRQEA